MRTRVLIISCREPLEKKVMSSLQKEGIECEELSSASFPQQTLPPADVLLCNGAGENPEKVKETFQKLRHLDEKTPIIVLSSDQKVESAVFFMQTGAFDYLMVPVDSDKLLMSIQRAFQSTDMARRLSILETQVGWEGKFDDIVGMSPQIQEVFQMIQTVSKSHATVLVMGESGTGKELVAKAIHRRSDRSKNKFIDINCGAIPRELLENELFGHERGSFTGADRQYIGSCERAHGGTLFLDEVSEMDLSLQVKLLRVLQERTITRIGGSEKMHIDIRVIAATNKDLKSEVDKGKFREDLYYRLNVVPMLLPPLRERKDDIPLLAQYFLEKFTKENNKKFKTFTPETLDAMMSYDWPGNVRELENNVERIVVLHEDSRVRLPHLPRFIASAEKRGVPETQGYEAAFQKIIPLKQVEQYAIEAALKRCMGDVVTTAKKLGIGQATLYRKLKKYGIKPHSGATV